jgi:TRAP transporter TAXI family solute receptor
MKTNKNLLHRSLKLLIPILAVFFTLGTVTTVAQVNRVSIGGAGTAGTFYIMAAGIAEEITRHLGVSATAEVTGGSVENARRMHSGELEFAMMQMDVGYQAYHGENFDPQVNMFAVAAIYPNAQHVVVRADSPYQTLSDLRGRRISMGAPGSGVLATNQTFLEALGWSMNDIQPQFLSFAENVTAFRDNVIDAALVNTAAPTPWVLDLETTHPIRLIPLTEEELETLLAQAPYYSSYEFPAGTYEGQDEAVPTFAMWVMLATRADIPDDLVYNVTRLLYENRDNLINIHPSANNISFENLDGVDIPFHPGAARYYAEQGYDVETR